MKTLSAVLGFFIASFHTTSADPDGEWAVIWEDTFSGSELNRSNWNVADNVTRYAEWEVYTADNVYVENDNLVIRTTANQTWVNNAWYNFSSGWVDTLGLVELQYGKFEARIKLPTPLPGVWPVYWLLDDNVQ
jgi:beta-glucanase (GH16 family)